MKLFLTLILISLIGNVAFAQLYGRFGYNFGKVVSPEFNDIVDIYNSERPFLDNQMKHLGILHGAVMGIGVAFPDHHFSMEFTWSNHHDILKASGTSPVTGEFATRYIKYRHNCLSYAFHFQIKSVPVLWWGFSLDMDNYRQFTRIDNEPYSWLDKSFIVEDRIFIIFDLPLSEKLSLQFQPYFQFPWWIGVEYDQFVDLALDVPYYEGFSSRSLPKNYGILMTLKVGGYNE